MMLRCVTYQLARLAISKPHAAIASTSILPARQFATHSDSSIVALGNLAPLLPPKRRKRVGRGCSSGRGGTATRGHKGQKARAGNGKPTPGFEGGQTPLMRRYPKRGFTNQFAKEYAVVNLDRIQEWIKAGRLDPTKPITAKELFESRCIHDYCEGVKVLARESDELKDPIHLVVSKATQTAIQQIERKGGSIVCKYYTANTLRALVKPHKYEDKLPPRDALPISKRELIWYASASNRGYLANLVPEKREPKIAEPDRPQL